MKMVLAGAMLALVSSAAAASSPDAWARFERDVARRCIAASGLQAARTSAIVGFDDTLGKVATLVSGREAVRGGARAATRLCVHDKRSRRTWVDEAEGWTAPVVR